MKLPTTRRIGVYCAGTKSPHNAEDLGQFEAYRPISGWEFWRVSGPHVHHELIATTPQQLAELQAQDPTTPAALRKLITAGETAPKERWLIRCPTCPNNLPLNDLFYGTKRQRTFDRLTAIADALADAPGVSRLPLSRYTSMLTS